ncbi:MAG: YitT family protein [Prevotella bivia]|uniref:YitT family protein n=1 Tax=Prevotella bivia TaxID=28125 RepID=UPI00255123B0|nr:YitT family protein [Prevotella bivia]MBS6329110.1 YitT family protein [Prevotella bivia]MDK7763569.1 YitT family protein [Prevotella bivia]MDU3908738.1 YitT family protein [Prevotella bivia]WIL18979.1 YitT family protein [Prevotella bivia]
MNNKFEQPKKGSLSLQDLLQTVLHLISTKKFWIELFIMTFGMFIAALGLHFFLIPSKLIVGSITGLSIVLSKLVGFISIGQMIFGINAILLILSFILIGNEFGAKTVYTALILGPMIDFISNIVPMKDSIFTTYIGTQAIPNPWFDLLSFVLILSASQAILFSINASTGGLDILAKIFNKYFHIQLGTAVTIAGGLICCTAFLINPVHLVVIGLIGTWLNGLILNYFMSSMNSKTRVFIISDDYVRIKTFITEHLGKGCTLHEVIGGYSGDRKIQLEVVLDKDDFGKLIDYMGKEQIPSFISSDVVSEVYGQWKKKGLLKTGNFN